MKLSRRMLVLASAAALTLPLASAALFDLGVYITVVGATLLTLSVLGHASKEGRGATSAPVRSRA